MFFVSFSKYPKIEGNDKDIVDFFFEFSFVLANKTNSKRGEDVSQIVEKSAAKTDI